MVAFGGLRSPLHARFRCGEMRFASNSNASTQGRNSRQYQSLNCFPEIAESTITSGTSKHRGNIDNVNTFRYVFGVVIVHTITASLRTAYLHYVQSNIGEQAKHIAPHMSCTLVNMIKLDSFMTRKEQSILLLHSLE